MALSDPIQMIEAMSRPVLFLVLVVLDSLVLAVMHWSTKSLNAGTSAVGSVRQLSGLLRLQMARDDANAAGVTAPWGERGRMMVAFAIGLDALLIVIYVGVLVLGCRMAADGFTGIERPAFATIGILLGWGAVAAAVFDLVENWGMMQTLNGRLGLPRLTSICARIKFTLIILAGVYVLAAIVVLRARFFT